MNQCARRKQNSCADEFDIQKLKEYISSLKKAAVAFSGGVDSTFLLKTAYDVLGKNCTAITAASCFVPECELKSAVSFCREQKIPHIVLNMEPLSAEGVAENPRNRCYLCKKIIFEQIKKTSKQNGIEHILEGTNSDDLGDFRPGLAALRELGITSPLLEFGFTKERIRAAAKQAGLSFWNKPSSACLASRFVYGEQLTKEKLLRVEKAESFLRSLGFSQLRVRVHQNLARIEVLPCEMEKLFGMHKIVSEHFKSLGFDYTALDLSGFKSGSMNI
ncbi:ATP-dependent sacrificial sulfur transferase LarE [Treponema sp.]|uniref:ATP-dependent sacrificial sulfur transferase LarE n=1 Tax=Treponema sp. TaxID=166 RepID=UPI003EFBAE21